MPSEWPKRVVSILLLIFSGVYLAGSLSLDLGSVIRPGLGFVPSCVGIFLCFMALLHLAKIFLFKSKPSGEKKEEFPRGKDLLRVTGLITILIFYGILLGLLGYILSGVILTMVMLRLLKMRVWVWILFVSILTVGSSYYFFSTILSIPLPRGILPF